MADVRKITKGLAKDVLRRETEDLADAVSEVVDEYVAGLTTGQALRVLADFEEERPDLFDCIEVPAKEWITSGQDVEQVVKATLYTVLERAIYEAIEQGVKGSDAKIPEKQDSRTQVFIHVEGDPIALTKEKIPVKQDVVDLGDAVKVLHDPNKGHGVVIQKMPEDGLYRVYVQTDRADFDIREFFKKTYNSIKEADYSLDVRDYIGGKKERKYTAKDVVARIIAIHNALAGDGQPVPVRW